MMNIHFCTLAYTGKSQKAYNEDLALHLIILINGFLSVNES